MLIALKRPFQCKSRKCRKLFVRKSNREIFCSDKCAAEWLAQQHFAAKQRGALSMKKRKHLETVKLKQQNNQCWWCDGSLQGISIRLDHLVPVAKGGESTENNLVLCCEKCNQKKRDHMPWDFMEGRLL